MKKIVILIIAFIATINMSAQIDIGKIFEAGTADAKTLAHPYLKPYGEMLGVNLNSGWYTSAKVHKLLGFDVTITGAYSKAPSSAKTFDVSKLDLQSFELAPNSTSEAQTIAGSSDNLPVLRHKDDPIGVTDFEMPDGSGMDYLVSPMVTFGVGLPMGIEIKGRYWPETKIGDAGKVSLWGAGVQKDIKDYIPGVKHVPVLNMSILAAYTNFAGSASMENVGGLISNGEVSIDASAFTTRLLIGANLPVIAFYTGLGYGRCSSDFNVNGDFGTTSTGESLEPINLSYNTNGFDFNVGLRLRLGVIGLHADYSVGEYSSITAGFGINFR